MKCRFSNWSLALSILIVLAVTVCLYWSGLAGSFLLDDFNNIHPVYMAEWDSITARHLIGGNDSGIAGRSLSMASFVFTGLAHGLDAWWYKYHNLLCHLLVGVGFYALGWKFACTYLGTRRATWVSLAAASLWLLHPMFVSTVLYPVQRMAQLSSLWLVFGVLVFVYGRLSVTLGHKLLCQFVLVPLIAICALLSKENGALLPVFLLLAELFIARERGRGSIVDSAARLLLILLPLIAGAVLLFVLFDRMTNYDNRDFDMSVRVLTQVEVVWFYIGQLLLPRLSQMSLFLDNWTYVTEFSVTWFVSFFAIVVLIFACLVCKRAPLVRFGVLWFFAGHLMESTFLPLEMVFEHRNYQPGWGIFFALAAGVFSLPRMGKKVGVALLALLLLFNAFLLFERVGYWSQHRLFASVGYAYHPDSYRATIEVAKMALIADDMPAGRTFMESASDMSVGAARTGPKLLILMSYCGLGGRGEVFDEVFDEALFLLEADRVDNYAMHALNHISLRVKRGHCVEISRTQLAQLATAVKKKNKDYWLCRVLGQLYSVQGEYALSHLYYHASFAMNPNIGLLREIFENDLAAGHPENAKRFLRQVQAKQLFGDEYSNRLLEYLKTTAE